MRQHASDGAAGHEAAAQARRELGQWLKGLREARGLSQRALADKLGYEFYTFISQIEAGKGRIPAERYEVWAEALGVPPRLFVQTVLKCYEPTTWRILFGSDESSCA